ncbi:MAG: hypothetical protein K0R05_3158 [Anaerocolumna sp.]|nr:hypothetical protein [Anaerocolumna sp.]
MEQRDKIEVNVRLDDTDIKEISAIFYDIIG